ncbi:MAG: NAD(P)H-binding protein [Nitrospirota bacterium]
MTSGSRTYAIMGASGHIGQVVAERLLAAGHRVRVLGRSADRLKNLAAQGAVPHVGAFDDVEALAEAFTGVDAVFAMIPPDYSTGDHLAFQDRVGSAIAQALQRARVRSVVNLSSLGAHLHERTGPIRGLTKQEGRLDGIEDLQVIHLRPTYFMENLLGSIPTIRSLGVNGSAFRADLPIPMVATRDIGAKAAEFLAELRFRGREAFEFAGPRPVTMQEATSVLGRAIGKPDLQYVQFPYGEAEKAMLAAGMKPDVVGLFLEMTRSFNEGLVQPERPMTRDHLGTTAIEQFAEVFAAAYRAATRT